MKKNNTAIQSNMIYKTINNKLINFNKRSSYCKTRKNKQYQKVIKNNIQ